MIGSEHVYVKQAAFSSRIVEIRIAVSKGMQQGLTTAAASAKATRGSALVSGAQSGSYSAADRQLLTSAQLGGWAWQYAADAGCWARPVAWCWWWRWCCCPCCRVARLPCYQVDMWLCVVWVQVGLQQQPCRQHLQTSCTGDIFQGLSKVPHFQAQCEADYAHV